MAALSESAQDLFFAGSGAIGKCVAGTLVGGACEINVGFNIILFAAAVPIHATAAVAVQTLTVTGLTIPTAGFIKTSNGKITVKSDVGGSTIQFVVFVIGM